jgi:hypothetical protein
VIRDRPRLAPLDFDLIRMWTVPAALLAPRSQMLAAVHEATLRGSQEILEVIG